MSQGDATQVMTAVTAIVAPEKETELTDGFRDLTAGPKPDGLVRSELLRGQKGVWRIQSVWRDREALEAMRSSGDRPSALSLFDKVGAEHSHEVFWVEHAYHS
jgi:quinol monooxygenase YgiN